MALITLEEAATRLGIPPSTVEDWVRQGLLAARQMPGSPMSSPSVLGPAYVPEGVEEDELADLAESLGWLQLGSEGWDSDEGR